MTEPPLPGVLAEIARVAGYAAALKVAAAKGGVEKVHFPSPRRLRAGHWLVEAVGLDTARRIAAVLGMNKFDVPLGPFAGARRRDTVRRALEQCDSTAKAARLLGIHERTARRHKSRGAKAETDLPLFGGRPREETLFPVKQNRVDKLSG